MLRGADRYRVTSYPGEKQFVKKRHQEEIIEESDDDYEE